MNKIKIQNIFTKKIRMTIYIIAVLWIGVITQIIVNKAFQDEDKIIQAFASTNSKVVESKLQIVADYGIRYMTQEDKEKLIEYLAGAIGLEKDYEIITTKGEETLSVTAEKRGKNADTKVEVISVEKNSQESLSETRQYIVITLSVYDQMDNIIKYKDMLEKKVKKLEIVSCDTAMQFIGSYQGQLSLKEKNKVTDELIEYIQGKIVNENRSEELYTVYAYTGIMDDYLTVEGHRVNINVAISYNEEKDQTNIYLATPILNEDF